MDWVLKIIRIAGASFPVASSLVQLQAELDSKEISSRISKLEDPVSNLHEDVPELSGEIYQRLKSENADSLSFNDEFYKKYSRSLAALESQGYIKGYHALGKGRYAEGLRVIDPSYIIYMCALEESEEKMECLIQQIDNCEEGKWLDGNALQKSIELPLPVVNAVFEIYESKGYGLRSKEIGSSLYLGQA